MKFCLLLVTVLLIAPTLSSTSIVGNQDVQVSEQRPRPQPPPCRPCPRPRPR